MKILYLSHRTPFPPNKGDKIRSFNEIKYLSSCHELHLACLADNPSDLRYENDLKNYCKKVCVVELKTLWARAKGLASLVVNRPISVGYFYSKSLQATVNSWLCPNAYDAIICFSSPMAEYLFRSPPLAHRFSGRAPGIHLKKGKRNKIGPMNPSNPRGSTNRNYPMLIMDFCDVDSDKWLQYSQLTRFPLRLIYRTENRCLFKYEKQINQSFDYSVFVSDEEANLFLRLFPHAKKVEVIPNGVDYDYFCPGRSYTIETDESLTELNELKKPNKRARLQQEGPILLFTGAMDYYANVEGVIWFSNEIFPAVKKEFPQAQFYVVGSNPHPKVRNLQDISGVKVTGFVEDIRPYYEAADVCVIPLRIARGIQNKILEAMAMEKAVVTTARAIEGIEAMAQKHVLVEDNPKGFAQAISKLVKDEALRNRLGAEGRNLVMREYSWQVNMKTLEDLLFTPLVA